MCLLCSAPAFMTAEQMLRKNTTASRIIELAYMLQLLRKGIPDALGR